MLKYVRSLSSSSLTLFFTRTSTKTKCTVVQWQCLSQNCRRAYAVCSHRNVHGTRPSQAFPSPFLSCSHGSAENMMAEMQRRVTRPKRSMFSEGRLNRHCCVHMSSSAGSGITERELKKEIDDLTDQFMETRELLADAMEAKGTVYFNEDLEDAKESVQETLARYQTLLAKLNEEQERDVRRTIGLKMEELRAQEAMIVESLKED